MFSDCIGEIGQQVERSWGDKEWVRLVLEKIVNTNEQNLPIIVHWMMEYGMTMNVFMVVNDANNAETLLLFCHLRDCSINEFLEDINRERARSATEKYEPSVRRVPNHNMFVIRVSKFEFRKIKTDEDNGNVPMGRKAIRLGRLRSGRKKEVTSDFVS